MVHGENRSTGIEQRTSVYNDDGMTCIPVEVQEVLGGITEDDEISWKETEDGSVVVEKTAPNKQG